LSDLIILDSIIIEYEEKRMKKKTRADKSLHQQIEDLEKAIEKHGDPNGTRHPQLIKLYNSVPLPF
jgi:hypothetical protein